MRNRRPPRDERPVPCAICAVRIDSKDEHLHMKMHHVEGSVQIGGILWITPHEAVYERRYYKPKVHP